MGERGRGRDEKSGGEGRGCGEGGGKAKGEGTGRVRDKRWKLKRNGEVKESREEGRREEVKDIVRTYGQYNLKYPPLKKKPKFEAFMRDSPILKVMHFRGEGRQELDVEN